MVLTEDDSQRQILKIYFFANVGHPVGHHNFLAIYRRLLKRDPTLH